jgi:hypothetical protein
MHTVPEPWLLPVVKKDNLNIITIIYDIPGPPATPKYPL